ncbi:hypothetical protein DMUE_2517, partial [Dictyocoela muelleri]
VDHNHASDDLTNHQRQFVSYIKEQVASNPFETAYVIHNQCLRRLSDSLRDQEDRRSVRTQFGSFERYRHRIYAEKRLHYPQHPKAKAKFTLDRSKAVTADGLDFLFIDLFDEQNTIVLADVEYIKKFNLPNCSLFIDGTFKTSTTQFYQLFIIHVLRGNFSFPLFYCFLDNKRYETYEMILGRIVCKLQDYGISLIPATVLLDLEEASFKAISSIFPNAEIKGCYFHFGQAIWRKCVNLGFKTLYSNNPGIRKVVKLIMALPLVPFSHIDEGWNLLQRAMLQIDENVSLLKGYFESTWMSNARPIFSVATWNHYNNPGPRTNNSAEGFHSKLSKLINKGRPNFNHVFRC